MLVKIYGNTPDAQALFDEVCATVDELKISELISCQLTYDTNLAQELNISKEPALILQEDAIDFKDTIFEGQIPHREDLKSMFVSILWIDTSTHTGKWCSAWGCSTCATGC